jgi:hypothetical protein
MNKRGYCPAREELKDDWWNNPAAAETASRPDIGVRCTANLLLGDDREQAGYPQGGWNRHDDDT